MKEATVIKHVKNAWNNAVIAQLRKIGIMNRLRLSFILLLISIVLMTFFSYYQYYKEINLNLDRYVSLLVQNVELKITDTMKSYEEIALQFYNEEDVLTALSENAAYAMGTELDGAAKEQYEQNRFLIENRLYNLGKNRKYIVNAQLVTPYGQYHMAEANGYQRGGTIRDLDGFYESIFYTLPQQRHGYPVWIDRSIQTMTFYKNNQNLYGLANIITMEVAIYDSASRNFLGILLMNIDLNAFSDSVESFGEYNDGNFFLVGQDGLLTWITPTLKAPSLRHAETLYEEMIKKDADIVRTEADGQRLLMAYERIGNTSVFAVYIADFSVLLARTYKTRNLCILVLILIFAICILLSNAVSISISAPLRQLVAVMHKTGEEKLETRYINTGNDEITILGSCFNEMLDQISQLINQVYLSEIRRQKSLISQKNARLNALLMQINPHFLYNTLDIIRWEAMYEAHGESNITRMIEKFSLLCRMSTQTDCSTIPLSEGLRHASVYLEVINLRHREKIHLELQTQDGAEQLYVPRFLLQPLMENAVIHAFDETENGNAVILIHSFLQERMLHILVEDNGKGMDEEKTAWLQDMLSAEESLENGVGLSNVHQRIRLFYGDEFGLSVRGRATGGTMVEIILPARTESENMEEKSDDLPGSYYR